MKKRNPHARQDTTALLHGMQCKECIQVIYIAPKEHLHPTGMMFVRTSRWKILNTPYLVIELSPSTEIWYVSVTRINDGTQILTFLGIDSNRDFQNSRFFCGNLIILNLSCIVFYFQINSNRCIHFPNCALVVKSIGISQ